MEAPGAFIFAPYHGTALRQLAIEKGYLDDSHVASTSNTAYSVLKMPTISSEEIQGLAQTFSYYVKFPEDRFDEIHIAERFNEEGDRAHEALGEEFDRSYRGRILPTDDSKKPIAMTDLHG